MPLPRGWLAVPADASRRFLVAAGTERYEGGDQLVSVPEDLRKVASFFEQLGYREQLPEVRLDPISSTLRIALSEWLNGPDRRDSDTAVIYYTGHGNTEADSFYLLTADTKDGQYAATALPADYVLRALGETPKLRRLLLILDTCYAGQGAFDASAVAARMSPWQNFGDGEGIWVVAAASPKQEAQERLFVEAFLEAVEQLQQTTGTLQPYIGLESLMEQINGVLQRSGKRQRARYIPVTQAMGLAPFIPNPRYEPDALPNVDLETRDWLRQHAVELAEYWGPKARGVEVATQVGWYFTGRQAALEKLSGWLADPGADLCLRVLTGDPGSGKSAVLGRLITRADTGPTPKPSGLPADPGAMPPVGSITAALLARRKTADELLAELSASLGAAADTELADTLHSSPVFVVVIDALDEAADPLSVVEKVISPLVGAASPGRGPRLLVATRRYQHLLSLLPAARITVDLDQDAYYSSTDTAEYVTKVLLAADDPDSPTPYRGLPDLARRVASQVADIAGHSFLIAQIAARTLARTPRALDPADVSAERQRWQDVGAAFDRDLDRYGEQARQVRDLLTPLAWAEGAGLPRELWASLATALAHDETYTQADITWLIEQAGFYLVEALDQDRSVYRLYHEQFAEHLRALRSPRSIHEQITAELLRHVPLAGEGRREWGAAAPYIRTHLATHAAKGTVLDQLVNDPGFLLAADPARLLPALTTVTDPEARNSASAFESTQYRLRDQPPGQAAAQLDLAASIYGATILKEGIGHLPYQRPWTIAWGHWSRPDRHVLLGRHSGTVAAVAQATVDGAPVAVTGSIDGVRVWNLRTGAARGGLPTGDSGRVSVMALGEVGDAPVAVTYGRDGTGTVLVWDLRTGAVRGKPLRGHTVSAMAVGEAGDIPVIITGGHDGEVRTWDLRTEAVLMELRRRQEHFEQTGGRRIPPRFHLVTGPPVTAVAVGEVDGAPIAISGDKAGVMRVWDLRTGAARGKSLRLPAGPVGTVALVKMDGDPVAVTNDGYGTVRAWDLRTGAARGKPLRDRHTGRVSVMAVGEVDDVPVVITGGYDSAVRVWDLRTRAARGGLPTGDSGRVSVMALGEVGDAPVAVTYGSDGTVRVWDLRTGAARGKPLRGHTGGVSAMAVGEAGDIPVIITGGDDGMVRVWNLRTATTNDNPHHEVSGRGDAMAVGKVDGTPVAVTGGRGGTVRMWDLRTGATYGEPLQVTTGGISNQLYAVAIAEVDGAPVAVTGSFDGTRLWDLRTRAALGRPLVPKGVSRRLLPSLRDHKWRVQALAVGEVDGTPVAVTGSRDGAVQVWNLLTRAPRGVPLRGHGGGVESVAITTVDGVPVIVSSGQDGVRIWDLRTGVARGEPLRGAKGASAMAVGEAGGIPVVITVRWDGLRVWDLRTGVARGEPLRGSEGASAMAVGEAGGIPVVVSGSSDGTISMWALDSNQRCSARFNVSARITGIVFDDQAGWFTSTADGSIFIWQTASVLGSATRRS
jgi:WD40 repeat protein